MEIEMKKVFTTLFILIVITITIFVLTSGAKNEPTSLGASGTMLKYSVDDLIKKSDLIVIGKITATLPTRWMGGNGGDPKNASPEDVIHARGLFTDSLISINQVLKGGNVKTIARVRSFTGETEKVRWTGESEPAYVIKKTYLLFLVKDYGPTAKVDHGDYIAVGAIQGVYEIVDGKAISKTDEWNLDELLAYIQNKLAEADSTATSTEILVEPSATEPPVETTPTP